MLVIVNRLRDLNFRALMDVYIEGNLKNGQDNWPDLPQGQQLLMAEQDFYQYLKEQFFTMPGACYALWRDECRPVCALRMEPYQDGWLLEALETLPERRKEGFATKLVKAALDHLGHGKIYSHVSKSNAASQAVHQKCGFAQKLDYAVYLDGSINRKAITLYLDMDKKHPDVL